jgi:hypothetical protein
LKGDLIVGLGGDSVEDSVGDSVGGFAIKLMVQILLWCCSPSHRQIRTVAVWHSHTPNRRVETYILLDDCFPPQNGQITSATG